MVADLLLDQTENIYCCLHGQDLSQSQWTVQNGSSNREGEATGLCGEGEVWGALEGALGEVQLRTDSCNQIQSLHNFY